MDHAAGARVGWVRGRGGRWLDTTWEGTVPGNWQLWDSAGPGGWAEVLGELTPSPGPVSAAQAGGLCGGPVAGVREQQSCCVRPQSSDSVWEHPSRAPVVFKWFQSPHARLAKNSGELPREDPACGAECGPAEPRTPVPQFPT